MNELTAKTVFSALLHDIGKIAYRAGEPGTHSESGYRLMQNIVSDSDILEGIRYHHGRELNKANIAKNSLAYIVYIADNIAAAADRRNDETESGKLQFRKMMPMSSIFNHMNDNHVEKEMPLTQLNQNYDTPEEKGKISISSDDYQNVLRELLSGWKQIDFTEKWVNSALSLMEAWSSSAPSSTNTSESADVSLYDHSKITAAAAACIREYLEEQGEDDYRRRLLQNEKKFFNEKAFLLYSADFSGIQNFIYTVASSNALKSLRSRSFFLELFMEHYIDEILEAAGMSRANLLYSGGGHCYLLLPNTRQVQNAVQTCCKITNRWMREQFGTRLYLADGYTACTANDLINHPAEDAPYKEMFARVSRMISTRKMSRYSAEELRELNSDSASEDGRECKICGTRTQLTAENKCYWCQLFEDLSSQILYKDVYLISLNKKGNHAIALPSLQGTVYLTMTDETEARKQLGENEDIVRVYTKNRICTGLAYATKLYVGDYHDSSRMDELGAKSTGIPRNAVCRMDVDNLGKAFISGFEQNSSNPAERYKFVTLSRTATFSRQMSLFFKFHINSILRGGAVTIVYSGGDDVFLVGAWDAVIEAAQKIQEDFDLYTCGTLSLSAGITINEVSHPIRRSASESQKLEDYAKHVPGKNAVALFEASDAHTYHWDEFRDRVVDEKLYTLEEFFDKQKKRDSTEDSRGKAFIYRMLDLLRNSEDKINLARFAYLLARMEPSKENRDYAAYAEFSQKMYRWYLNEKDRKELITAIYIYVYQTRNV